MTEENHFSSKQKPAPNLQKFRSFGFQTDLTVNALLLNLFSVFSQVLLVVETRVNAFLGDNNKVLSIKKNSTTIKAEFMMQQQILFQAF